MGFAERNGFVKEKTVQVDEIDRSLRNRLYNMVHRFSESSPMIHEELEYVVDRLGYQVESTTNRNWYIINTVLEGEDSSIPWYMPYEVIELFFEAKRLHCKECEYRSDNSCEYCGYTEWFRNVTTDINIMLEQEKSGYRLLNDKFVNIISDEELQEINKIIDSPYQAVKIHINKALTLYSDRKKPDYENSIKESISAVESLCCIITGATGSQLIGYMMTQKDSITIMVPKSQEAIAVSEIVSPTLSYKVIEYNHHALQGNIEAKKSIILLLADQLESKREALRSINKTLENNIFFLYNSMNIRHNNCDPNSKNYKEHTANMPIKELEFWYDEIYQLSLLAFLELDNIERTKQIEVLKRNY